MGGILTLTENSTHHFGVIESDLSCLTYSSYTAWFLWHVIYKVTDVVCSRTKPLFLLIFNDNNNDGNNNINNNDINSNELIIILIIIIIIIVIMINNKRLSNIVQGEETIE